MGRIDPLEKEITKLKIQLQVLVELLTTNMLSILGPDPQADYSTTMRRETADIDRKACLSTLIARCRSAAAA